MQQICSIGEVVYDIIFRDSRPQEARVGGSMLNVAVSVARAGVPVQFCGAIANDAVGRLCYTFIKNNHIRTEHIGQVNGAKSNLALAFLNDDAVPDYQFYRDPKLNGYRITVNPEFVSCAVLGSFFSLRDENFNNLSGFIETCANTGTLVVYDPNVRDRELHKNRLLIERVAYFMRQSSIFKASVEDMEHITGTSDRREWHGFLQQNNANRHVVICGPQPVIACFDNNLMQVPVPGIDVVSTIGAGDAFTAGFVSEIYGREKNITEELFYNSVQKGVLFASQVCQTYDNYIPDNGYKKKTNLRS